MLVANYGDSGHHKILGEKLLLKCHKEYENEDGDLLYEKL